MINKNIVNDLNIRLKNGQSEAFHELYQLYYSSLYKYALKLTLDSQHAKDLVQEAIIKLWNKRHLIREDKSINKYLFQIIKNLFNTHYAKKLKQQDSLSLLIQETISEFIEQDDPKVIQLKRIEKEIEKLPPKSKKIFNLNKKRGLNYKEISEMLNLSEKTVESHVYRAMQRIKEELSTSNNTISDIS